MVIYYFFESKKDYIRKDVTWHRLTLVRSNSLSLFSLSLSLYFIIFHFYPDTRFNLVLLFGTHNDITYSIS